jgi:hypothetical protein
MVRHTPSSSPSLPAAGEILQRNVDAEPVEGFAANACDFAHGAIPAVPRR